MNGILVIDKPTGPTSHDVVTTIKKRLGARRVGHIGTLDPMATGVLPLCVNDATKLIRFFEQGEKEYCATMKLGEETDTYDREGRIVATRDVTGIKKEDIISVIHSFHGRIQLVPPMFSALKRDGVSLYKLARQGITVERAPRDVEIYTIEVKDIAIPLVTFRVVCSKGTYIRSLAFDMGRRLGCGAHLVSLRRTKNGYFSLEQSISLDAVKDFQEDMISRNIIPVERLLAHIPEIEIDSVMAKRIMDGVAPKITLVSTGRNFSSSLADDEMVRFTLKGGTVALARYKGKEGFKLERVFKNSAQ